MSTLSLLPVEVDREDISILTEVRQEILVELLHKEKNLSRLNDEIEDFSRSTIAKALEKLQEKYLVNKNDNRVYELTGRGTDLALIIAEPNGLTENELTQKLKDRVKTKLIDNGVETLEAEKKAIEVAEHLREMRELIQEVEKTQQETKVNDFASEEVRAN